MFKIESNIAYEAPVSGKKAQEKQALLNMISMLKSGESIFVDDTILQYPSLRRFIEDTLKERFHQKNLVYKKVEENKKLGTRIWSISTIKPV